MHYFADYVDNSFCAYPLIGVETESSVDSAVVPYIKALLKNIEPRFGDSMNNISIAVNIFDPTNKTDSNHDSDDKLAALCTAFNLRQEDAMTEWACFLPYLVRMQQSSVSEVPQAAATSSSAAHSQCESVLTSTTVLKKLVTADLAYAFSNLSKLATIILACPIGTASVERSFSTMNRLCTKLRQRLTSEHLDDLMIIAVEGPPELSDDEKRNLAYMWYRSKPTRRMQLP